MEGDTTATAWFFVYVAGFVGSCGFALLVLYNLVGIVSYMREDTAGESASAMAKAAWAIGFLSFALGPCAWVAAALAIVLARIERGRIYQERAPLAGATPCRMASVNGGITLAIWAVITASAVAAAIQM